MALAGQLNTININTASGSVYNSTTPAGFLDLARSKSMRSSPEPFDARTKDPTLERHKYSDMTHHLFSHLSPPQNANPLPFKVNEDGRRKQTEVLDKII